VAKLLTCAAALQTLGPAATIETTAVIAPGSRHLVLVGAGDVLLGSGDSDPTAVIGRAGLGDLAEQVAAELSELGQTSVTVSLDDSLLGGLGWGDSMGPGWSNADLAHGFVAPVTGLAVDAGRIRRENYSPRVADPGLDATQVFSEALRQNGITVEGPNLRERAPAGAAPIATVRSAPVAELVGYLLATSDNNAAEALARLVAIHGGAQPGFAQGGAAVLAALSGLGLDTAGSTLADGSGLSNGSLVSPALLTGTLAAAASDEHPTLRALLEGLAVGGLTGTLTDRFASPADAAGVGVVRAKTGSLAGVSTLAGTLVTADGRLLAFAVMADRVPATDPARQALDRIAAALVGCGCR
jgi:D-alanyl-D-alanine carboxypeptidase/D-alanyl-D-alanine-endopeptidase (penicillin-binding protein 4)